MTEDDIRRFRDVEPFPNGETLRDRLIASGVLGSGSPNHPTDLSTNPKYMEGFGESSCVPSALNDDGRESSEAPEPKTET